ncbi:ABC transporter ATP-binding protein [Herbiconiux sp. 11R-BC]|uniref:ABC transporter ATP-binding protein n=1 Tax=Herbiconiux sp. 11R-BC TaxID=3111637 RepID=UPI003C0F11BE
MAELVVENVTKTFQRNPGDDVVTAIADISLRIDDGEFVSIVGPSGCGKSTLFSIVAGLSRATSGTVALDGRGDDLLGSVGLMPQRDLLMPWKTVLDNTAIGPRLRGASRQKARAEADSYFEEFGLSGFQNRWPSELSGGMRQRAALLRTFLGGQEILLLDEPFGALDALTRRAMQAWLLDVWERHRRTILFITHDVDEAILLSDRVLVMTGRPGTIADDCTIDLPRPRLASLDLNPQFLEYKRRLLRPLETSSRSDASASEPAGVIR